MKTITYPGLIALFVCGWSIVKAQEEILPLAERLVLIPETEDVYYYQPAPGDRLIYEVSLYNWLKYEFIVDITRYPEHLVDQTGYPVAFDWLMTDPISTRGKVEICAECLIDNISYTNFFKDGDHLKLDASSTVFMSRRNFYEVQQNDDRSTNMIIDGNNMTFYDKDNYYRFPVKVNDKQYELLVSYFNDSPDMDGDNAIGVQAEGSSLIVFMDIAFKIILKEIIATE